MAREIDENDRTARDASDASRAFSWRETRAILEQQLQLGPLTTDDRSRCYVRDDGASRTAVVPPLVQLPSGGLPDPRRYIQHLETPLGRYAVVLIQAGAVSAGYWDDDALVAHRGIKKYVVRGRGRAQPSFLKTKGKSRYGSRLRLRNAVALLRELNETLHAWWREFGAAGRVYYSCPVRTWPELFRIEPKPPFERGDSVVKIPLHVHRPSHRELIRVRYLLTHGRVTEKAASEPN